MILPFLLFILSSILLFWTYSELMFLYSSIFYIYILYIYLIIFFYILLFYSLILRKPFFHPTAFASSCASPPTLHQFSHCFPSTANLQTFFPSKSIDVYTIIYIYVQIKSDKCIYSMFVSYFMYLFAAIIGGSWFARQCKEFRGGPSIKFQVMRHGWVCWDMTAIKWRYVKILEKFVGVHSRITPIMIAGKDNLLSQRREPLNYFIVGIL